VGCASRLPLGALQRMVPGAGIAIPFYHLVGSEPVPHVGHLYSFRSPETFEEDLRFFRGHFNVIGLDRVIRFARGGDSLPRNPLLVTFDDGLREVLTVAAPVMARHGIAATVFVNPAFLDNRDMAYRHKASLIVDRLRRGAPEAARAAADRLLGAQVAGADLERKVLAVGYGKRALLDRVADILGLDVQAYLRDRRPYLDRADVAELLRQGHHVGSHSIDHPAYRDLTLEEQLRQTVESTRTVREIFGLDYGAFAFPFEDEGITRTFFERLFAEGGTDVTFGTAGLMRDAAPRNLPRICFDNRPGPARRIVARALAIQWFKELMGKGAVTRGA